MKLKPLVVDNSVVMAWCFQDEVTPYATGVLEYLRESEAFAPAIWPLELGNALLVGERRGRLSQTQCQQVLALLAALPFRVEESADFYALEQIVALARTTQLSTYDASYLDLAMRKGLPIATQDKSLLKAAKMLGVPVFRPKPPQR